MNETQENPYRGSEVGHDSSGTGLLWRVIRTSLLVAVLLVILVPLLIPATRSGREASRRTSCFNNTRQITLSLLNYESEHGEFPPAYSVDEEGNRLHSWRTLILPYLEGNTVHELIDYSKPWDDEANAEAREVFLQEYRCPSSPVESNITNYMAVVGPGCLFDGSTPRKIEDIEDGTSRTLMLVEVADREVHWMDPQDITLEELLALNEESQTNHVGGFIVGFVDGHTEFMDVEVDRDALNAMATIAGQEKLDDAW